MKVGGLEKMIFSGAIIFLLLPLFVFAQESTWNLKQRQVIDILDIIRKEPLSTVQFDLYYDSMYYPESDNSAKAGAVMLTKQSILQSELDYWFVKMPVEFSKRFIKAVYKLLPLVSYGDFSGVIDLIEKYTVEQANNYIDNWLKQNQTQIGSGIGKYSFPSYRGNWQTINIPYIIVYSLIGVNKAKIVVEFYSKMAVEPPQNKGGIGALGGNQDHTQSTVWPWDIWLQSRYNKNSKTPNKIEPFIVRVKGQVIKDKYGNFTWDKSVEAPSVEVEFGKPVPEIDQSDIILKDLQVDQSQGFLKDKINQIKQTAQGIVNQIKDFFAIFKPTAQIASFIPPQKTTETNIDPRALEDISKQSQEIVEQVEQIVTENNATTIEEDLLKTKTDVDQLLTLAPIATSSISSTSMEQATTTCNQSVNQEPDFDKIIFNEIAWMGTTKSASDEWIELKNISVKPIDLNGWQIFNKSQNLKIFFTTTTVVAPGGFLLLERTDDNTVPAVKADRIYTGSMSNTDEMLYLVDPNCVLQDKIKATPYWPEGDNITKETMERNQFYGWQTSSVVGGTPKARNSAGKTKSSGGGAPDGSLLKLGVDTEFQQQDLASSSQATLVQAQILIVEIQIADSSSTQNDFIKLFNQSTTTAVNLSGWQFKKRSSSGSESSIKVMSNGVVGPQEYFIWLNSGYATSVSFGPSAISGQATSTQTISNNNSVALFNKTDEIVDRVAWGSSTNPFVEGVVFSENPTEKQNLIRRFFTTTNQYQDTGDNSLDFVLKTVETEFQQQDLASSTQEAPQVLIVEIQIEGNSSTSDDFIKIFNYSTTSVVDIAGWYFRKRSSSGSESSIKVMSNGAVIQPQSYFMWLNSHYATTIDSGIGIATSTATIAKNNSIALLNKSDEIIDQVAWGSSTNPFVEGQPFSQNPEANKNLIRIQNTSDNSVDFVLTVEPEELPELSLASPGITNLMAVPSTVRGSIDLFWVSPTTTLGYIIKKSEQEITTSSWDTAEIISQNIVPKPVGEVEFLNIGGLDTSKKYYFAIKYTGLTSGIASLLSDSVSATAWPGFQDNNDDTITDLRTGLAWFKDASSSVNNFGASSTQNNAVDFIAGQNSDWRLPNFKELASLIEYKLTAPSIWPGFENVSLEKYWASNKRYVAGGGYAGPSRYTGWRVDFSNGQIDKDYYDEGQSNFYPFMAVKGNAIPGGMENDDFDFTDNTDGTVRDNRTGLMWLKARLAQLGEKRKTWDFAFSFATNAVLCNDGTLQGTYNMAGDCSNNGGVKYDDWRLPNVQEMMEITKMGNSEILLWTSGYSYFYWSSTMFDENIFWFVGESYNIGWISPGGKNTYQMNIQLVRDP